MFENHIAEKMFIDALKQCILLSFITKFETKMAYVYRI